MPTHHGWGSRAGHYFCTFTCWEWLPLIEQTLLYDRLYAWMHLVTTKGCTITGYVFMPNHVHLLMVVPEGGSINTILSNAKRFLAYEVVARLEKAGRFDILQRLSAGLTTGSVPRGQKHRVWRTSSDIKSCESEAIILQKLNYIHANPVRGKWSLVEDAVEYPYSSAAFYYRGDRGSAPVRHYAEFL